MNYISEIIARICGSILYLFIIGICGTLRITINNFTGKELLKNENFIFALWHKNTFLTYYLYRNKNISIFVADDLKGKILGISTYKLGFDPVTLDGKHTRSIIRIRKKLENGQNIAMAVDGPKGPAMKIKDGTQYLTKKTGVPTIALTVHYSAAVKLFWRWDKCLIPLPFSRSTVTFSSLFNNNSDWKELENALGN